MSVDMSQLYRLPWSDRANGLSWLEITNECDLTCPGCYRKKDSAFKTLQQIEEECEVFKRNRTVDCMSIAGGEPLMHPDLLDVIRMVKRFGWRPILNTNGLKLTREKLVDFKRAGLSAVTFHIDSSQERPDCKDNTDLAEVTRLKDKFADMVRDVGGLACNFNHTVSETNIHEVPLIAEWGRKRAADVDAMVFVCYRDSHVLGDFDYFANGKKLTDAAEVTETTSPEFSGTRKITVRDIFEALRSTDPNLSASAYLNGTGDPSSLKWLFITRMIQNKDVVGYMSPTLMKVAQVATHLAFDRWLSFLPKALLTTPKTPLLLTSLFDPGSRRAVAKMPGRILKNPLNALYPVKMQTIVLVQPMDILEDGTIDMCEGCPDMTVYDGRLYRSCRLEELKRYGTFFTAAPKNAVEAEGTEEVGRIYPYHPLLKCTPGMKKEA